MAFCRGRCQQSHVFELRSGDDAAGVCFLNRHGGKSRLIVALVIAGSCHADGAAGRQVGSGSAFQAAGKLAVAALHGKPRLITALFRAGAQNEKRGRADTLELLLLEVVQLDKNNGGGRIRLKAEWGRVRANDEVFTGKRQFLRVPCPWPGA